MKKRIIEAALPLLTVWILLAGCNAAEKDKETSRIQTETEGVVTECTSEETTEETDIETGYAGTKDITDSETALNETENEILPEEAYRYVYYDFLKEYAEDDENSGNSSVKSEEVKFALAYIDDDEIPELLLIEGDFSAIALDVYAYADDAVIKLFSFHSDDGSIGYVEEQGYIFSIREDFDRGVERFYDFYAVENGEVSPVSSLHALLPDEEETWLYEADEVSVDADTFHDRFKELRGEREYTWINGTDGTSIGDTELAQLRTGELQGLFLTLEEGFKKKILGNSKEDEPAIVWMDYDDYDGDGNHEMFALCGKCSESYGQKYYSGTLWYADADDCMPLRRETYRMMDGKMEFASDAKYLFFYTDYNFTANITEIWTVADGRPAEDRFSQMGEVVYRGGSDFEIWLDAYDGCYWLEDDLWTEHTYKPYFYYYDEETAGLEKYAGEIISKEAFAQLSGIDLIAEIEAEGYETGDIIRWENDIITINYAVPPQDEPDAGSTISYRNIIWDNEVKDYWLAEGITSWKYAGVGGSFSLSVGIGDGWELSREMTDEELCKRARQYYEKYHDGFSPEIVEVVSWEYDKAVIRLYDNMEDHTATYDWYIVDRRTGIGEDLLSEEVNLLE